MKNSQIAPTCSQRRLSCSNNAEIERKLPGNEEANVAARAAAQAVLRSHDEAAKAHVLQFLGPALKLQLVSRSTGTEIWEELKNQHAEWMLTMGPQWMRDFHQLRPRSNQTVADFCNDADLLAQRLSNCGHATSTTSCRKQGA